MVVFGKIQYLWDFRTFNCVPNRWLIVLFHQIGIVGKSFRLLKRHWEASCSNSVRQLNFFRTKTFVSGLVQGSTFSQILFIIYFEPLPDAVKRYKQFLNDGELYPRTRDNMKECPTEDGEFLRERSKKETRIHCDDFIKLSFAIRNVLRN